MSFLKKLDKKAGQSMRWLFGQLTGNTVTRSEGRILERIQEMEDRILPALDNINRMRDDLERDNLELYKRAATE